MLNHVMRPMILNVHVNNLTTEGAFTLHLLGVIIDETNVLVSEINAIDIKKAFTLNNIDKMQLQVVIDKKTERYRHEYGKISYYTTRLKGEIKPGTIDSMYS